jgi:hypothetical protein
MIGNAKLAWGSATGVVDIYRQSQEPGMHGYNSWNISNGNYLWFLIIFCGLYMSHLAFGKQKIIVREIWGGHLSQTS